MILGSYNWTNAGAYDNDDNTLIIHDRELARAYYAEWQRLWTTVPVERGCSGARVYRPMGVLDNTTAKIRGTAASMPRLPALARDVIMKT